MNKYVSAVKDQFERTLKSIIIYCCFDEIWTPICGVSCHSQQVKLTLTTKALPIAIDYKFIIDKPFLSRHPKLILNPKIYV